MNKHQIDQSVWAWIAAYYTLRKLGGYTNFIELLKAKKLETGW